MSRLPISAAPSLLPPQPSRWPARLPRFCAVARMHVDRLALLIVISCSSLLQAAITDQTGAIGREALRAHMRAMVLGYLHEMRADEAKAAAG
jgi:hypothetical protein